RHTSHIQWYLYLIHMLISNITFFFFNDTATTKIYTLSLHDALPILSLGHANDLLCRRPKNGARPFLPSSTGRDSYRAWRPDTSRSEEHTSELQSQSNLVCRLLLEKKKKNKYKYSIIFYKNNNYSLHL